MDEVKDPQKALDRRIKRHVTSQEHTFFAVVQPGFEQTAAKELDSLGIKSPLEITEGGIEFSGTLNDCYRINIASRTITRLIMRIGHFKTTNFINFKKRLLSLPWEFYIKPETHIETTITSRHSRLYHTGRLEEELKSAIEKRLIEHGIRPRSVGKEHSQLVFIRLKDDRCAVSIDSSGEPLYKRGYKVYSTAASLRETTAALILLEAQCMKYPVIVDPMCGSGTFGIEASEMAAGLLPGRGRHFSFMDWPAFREKSFLSLLKKEKEQRPDTPDIKVFMSDIHNESVKTARLNCTNAGIPDSCQLIQHDFFSGIIPGTEPEKPALMVLNPPYGKRLTQKNIETFYRKIGGIMRKNYHNWGYAIICPGLEMEKILSLHYDRKVLFMNGGIKVSVIIRDAAVN